MTAVSLTTTQHDFATSVVREIGLALRVARQRAGETRRALARAVGGHETTVFNVEEGIFTNAKLGSVLRYFEHYDLTLAVVPRSESTASTLGAIERLTALMTTARDDVARLAAAYERQVPPRDAELAVGTLLDRIATSPQAFEQLRLQLFKRGYELAPVHGAR